MAVCLRALDPVVHGRFIYLSELYNWSKPAASGRLQSRKIDYAKCDFQTQMVRIYDHYRDSNYPFICIHPIFDDFSNQRSDYLDDFRLFLQAHFFYMLSFYPSSPDRVVAG